MKKLLILFTLFLGLGIAKAQTKKAASKPVATKTQQTTTVKEEPAKEIIKGPSKEETQNYIISTLKGVQVYNELNPNRNDRNYGYVLGAKGLSRHNLKEGAWDFRYFTNIDDIRFEECVLNLRIVENVFSMMKGTNSLFVVQKYPKDIRIDLKRVENVENLIFYSINGQKIIIENNEEGIVEDALKIENSIKIPASNNLRSDFDLQANNISKEKIEKLTKAFNHLRKLCGASNPISFD